MAVYPNPTTESITVEFNPNTEVIDGELFIYSSIGKLVMKISLTNKENIQSVDLKGLENGIYFLKVVNNGSNVYSSKVIKMK